MPVGIDHVDFEEALGQVLGLLAHVVDGLPDGPGRRHRDELGLHAPPGRLFRIVEARELGALGRRKLLEDFGLLFLGQVFQDVDGVVGIEIADALGDGLGRQLLEDFLAHRVVDFGQRREVEVLAHQLDELRPQIPVERLDQVAGVGFVQFADQRAQQAGVASFDRLGDLFEVLRADRTLVVA